MPKTAAPGTIDIPGIDTFQANAMPDPFDGRDLLYRPRLDVLPHVVDGRRGRHIYRQDGQSCTGHAVAAVINHVLRARAAKQRVSPYMLYRLARRYDEFPGDADAGSSLRGALKGWFNHGAALETEWPAAVEPAGEPDVDDPVNLRQWRERPLGAFYRVNPFRLDDVQSAITELDAIAVSGVVHEGWRTPTPVTKGGETIYVIPRPVDAKVLGGHAYCIVGYNEVGFLVQNSWGSAWGKGGFATLPYEDWLDTAYDAWVARPGVPQTPFYSGRSRTAAGTNGELVTAAAPDLRRLSFHVVNTGNDGSLSQTGKFVSTPAQVDRIVGHMGAWHDHWAATNGEQVHNVVLWAHGGGVAEQSGLAIANRQLNWWLNQRVYPITLVWETGVMETLQSAVEDVVKGLLPSAGIGFDFMEQVDRLVEGVCRRRLRWAWHEMKENAERATDVVPGSGIVPGGRLLVQKLAAYAASRPKGSVRFHLVAHSAGSVYQAALLDAFADEGLVVDTMTWLAPAITVERFRQRALPRMGSKGTVRRFTCFNLSDRLELDDAVEPVYHKSAVYLASRGFEDALSDKVSEVPLVGLAKYWTAPDSTTGRSLLDEVVAAGGELIVARSAAPSDARTDATTHAAFDEDAPTLTSVVMRILGSVGDPDAHAYQSFAALGDKAGPWSAAAGASTGGPVSVPAGAAVGSGGATRGGSGAGTGSGRGAGAASAGGTAGTGPGRGSAGRPASRRRARAGADEPTPVGASGAPGRDTQPAGETPLLMGAEIPKGRPRAPRSRVPGGIEPEVASAPRTGTPILDILAATGWKEAK
jgi:hypothetical protein